MYDMSKLPAAQFYYVFDQVKCENSYKRIQTEL